MLDFSAVCAAKAGKSGHSSPLVEVRRGIALLWNRSELFERRGPSALTFTDQPSSPGLSRGSTPSTNEQPWMAGASPAMTAGMARFTNVEVIASSREPDSYAVTNRDPRHKAGMTVILGVRVRLPIPGKLTASKDTQTELYQSLGAKTGLDFSSPGPPAESKIPEPATATPGFQNSRASSSGGRPPHSKPRKKV
jgi:hypothetical protein